MQDLWHTVSGLLSSMAACFQRNPYALAGESFSEVERQAKKAVRLSYDLGCPELMSRFVSSSARDTINSCVGSITSTIQSAPPPSAALHVGVATGPYYENLLEMYGRSVVEAMASSIAGDSGHDVPPVACQTEADIITEEQVRVL